MGPTKTWMQQLAALVLGVSAAAAPAGAPNGEAVETTAPEGEYQTAWLTLEKAGEGGADLPLFVGLRAGRAVQVWYCEPARRDSHQMWLDRVTLALAGTALRGEASGRMVKHWAPIAHVGDYVLRLDAKAADGEVGGTFALKLALKGREEQSVRGALRGALRGERQVAQDQALPAGADWGWFYGVGAALRAPDCRAEMIVHLGAARPLYKAEEPLPCMWGKGPEDRYFRRACVVGCTGGTSSPVVAGGRVYCFYYRPTGAIGAGPIRYAAAAQKFAGEKEILACAAEFTPSPIGQRALVDWYRPFADDVVVCIDAATGKTVWTTRLKDRAVNFQAHKWRGFNPTPFVAGGMVYVVNYANRVYALDAAGGKPAWEYAEMASKQFTASAAGPVVADGVVVANVGGLVGLEAKTGRAIWKARGQAGSPLLWRHDGVERVVVFRMAAAAGKTTAGELTCVEPRTGRELWKAGIGQDSVTPGDLLIDGDRLVGAEAKKGSVFCCRLKPDGLETLWSVQPPNPAANGTSYALAIADGCVYGAGEDAVFALKLDTGERIGVAKDIGSHNHNVTIHVMGSRLLLSPDTSHGRQQFSLFDVGPGGVKRLGGPEYWSPPHPQDTSYNVMPLMYPMADGRIFIRGVDGLYCYDLRAAGK